MNDRPARLVPTPHGYVDWICIPADTGPELPYTRLGPALATDECVTCAEPAKYAAEDPQERIALVAAYCTRCLIEAIEASPESGDTWLAPVTRIA